MHLDAIYSIYQQVLQGCALYALLAICAAVVGWAFYPLLKRLWCDWLHLDGFGKVAVAVFAVGLAYYGATKQDWRRVPHDGADDDIGIVGVFTCISNDVQDVGGVAVTNEIPLVMVAYTNGTVTASTEISYRESDTNDWTGVIAVDSWHEAEGTTNMFVMVVSDDMSGHPYWWVGSNKPATVITSSDLKVTLYEETADYVRFEWTCTQPLATEFMIWNKETTESEWHFVATTTNKYIQLDGFYVGKNRDWKISSTYMEDGE